MRRFFIVFCLLFLTVTLHAQDEQYRLVTPTLDDYFDVFIEYGAELVANESSLRDSEYNHNPDNLIYDIIEILYFLYPDFSQTTFEQQLSAYEAIEFGKRGYVERDVWVQHMVEQWLSENDVDLNAVDELQFEDFYITVIPRDFNADGMNEYLLDVMKGAVVDREGCIREAEVVDYLFAQQTNSGYRFIETNLPWKGYPTYGRYSGSDGGMIEILFDDLNADGLPEWVVLDGANTAGGPGMGYSDFGLLFILGWRNDGLEFLSPNYITNTQRDQPSLSYESLETTCGSPYPLTVEWEFTDVDGDAPKEILQIQRYADNWDCKRTETRIFDWDSEADQYLFSEELIEYADNSQNCVQRDAEEIMWTGDYAAAIPVYEYALTLERVTYPDAEYPTSYPNGLYQYIRARLAFAYMTTGQPEQAEPLLRDVLSEEPADAAVYDYAEALDEMLDKNADPLEICAASYRVFTSNFPEIRVGYTGDERYQYAPDYQPERVGCDAPSMIRDALTHREIPLEVSPVDLLADLGIGIERSLETDLNNDGLSEWLIAPDIPGMELFFAPDGEIYRISFPVIDPFSRSTDMQVWELPQDNGSAIAMTTFDFYDKYNSTLVPPWHCAYDPFCGMGGGGYMPECRQNDEQYLPGAFRLWRLDNSELMRILSMDTCERLIADFPGQEGLNEISITLVEFDDYTGEELPLRPNIYLWDTQEQRYIYQAPTQPTVEPTPASTPEPRPRYYSVGQAFYEQDFEAVLLMMDETITFEEGENRDGILADYFYRALSLQALGRDDEALAVFVAIHDIAPNHIWGILAQLHFEVVE